MENNVKERLAALRLVMKTESVDCAVIPHTDPHQSEYLAPHWQTRRYLSGFTGSAGTLVVTKDKAALWTDSRYFIQAAAQLAGTGIELMKDGLKETPAIPEWIAVNTPDGGRVGIDGWLITAEAYERLKLDIAAFCQSRSPEKAIAVTDGFDPVNKIWLDRPQMPDSKAFVHEEKFAGEPVRSKIGRIKGQLDAMAVDAVLLTALDEIAWTLNLRGSDVRCNPVNTCFLFVSSDNVILFIDPSKVDSEVAGFLSGNDIRILPYIRLEDFIDNLSSGTRVAIDFSKTASRIVKILGTAAVNAPSPVAMFKAIKNDVQVQGFRDAMRRDGAALCYAFKEIEERLHNGIRTTEMDVADILLNYRSKQPLFFDESFSTIAGYGEHGAIVHYSATKDTDIELKPEGLLLVDSGAQYLDGTTDITRTISLGNPSPEEKRDFTLVLKGMIALAAAVFPQGTRGVQLDILAHQFLWKAGQQYLHGTGHGVGHFLNVHEGPQTIRNNNNETPLLPGMVTSDEPGLYKEGKHGIRCENLILTVPVDIPGSDSFRYLAFETLTLFPFDTGLIDTEIFTAEEKDWIDAYHDQVFVKLSPLLDEETRQWLRKKTLPIK